jgi:large subunit ribosomal protein L25
MGGTLQTLQREVTVECLPAVIPEYLEVDVSKLDIGDSLHVSDIVLPAGVTLLTDPEETLFVLSGLMTEEAEEVAEEAAEGAAAEGAAEEAEQAREGGEAES